jgi:hypothetical protein
MARIKVYKVQLYNAVTDAPMISRRMATRQGAEIEAYPADSGRSIGSRSFRSAA